MGSSHHHHHHGSSLEVLFQGPGSMSASAQQLAEELQIFGLDCEEALIEKLVELCVQYGQNEEGMVGELIAFCTSTHKVGLTSEILNSFEHEFLSKRLSKAR
uniref:DNA polymerase subunit alpha B n=1 Tax=Homo sapiens TaxID=9606 RepID=UPI0001C3974F|nr:Chain A, DNA polymerase subunit alpha B [Homo sapiens]